MAIWKRLVPAVAALALLAGCGEVAPGDSADEGGGKGRQWVLRFDTSDGSADGESIAGLYLTITPETGKMQRVEVPATLAAAASGPVKALLVDSRHEFALRDTRPPRADRVAHQVRMYSLADGSVKTLDLGDVTPDYVAFVPDQPKLTVVSGREVWQVDQSTGEATKVGRIKLKPQWLYLGGFTADTAMPYVEKANAFVTDPPGYSVTDKVPIQRGGGSVLVSNTGNLAGLPKTDCDLVGGFTDADNSSWAACVKGTDLQMLKLDGEKWQNYGKKFTDVVPEAAVEMPFLLPPLD